MGAYGVIIIDPKEPEPCKFDREYVVQLFDWSDEDLNNVYRKLKKLSHYYNFRECTISDAWQKANKVVWENFWTHRGMWNEMRMSDHDSFDVTRLFKRGEKILLRFINAAAMAFFDVRISGLKMTVVAWT